MKSARILLWTFCLFLPGIVFAQELKVITVERSDGSIAEQYEVLKKRKSIKNGIYKRFYGDGQVNFTASFLDNIPNGPVESRHPNGHPAVRGVYLAGMKSGDWAYLDAEGMVRVRGTFIDDLEEGEWLYTNPDGYRISVTYQKGKLNGPWELRFQEQLIATCNFTNGLPDSGSLKPTTDSIYRYADSLYMAPEVNPYFTLLKFDRNRLIKLVIPEEPRYVSGILALRDYLEDCVRLPMSVFPVNSPVGIEKRTCYVKMIVSQYGLIENVEILRSFSDDLDREIIGAVKEMPIWIPAINRNNPVRSSLTIAYSFQTQIVR